MTDYIPKMENYIPGSYVMTSIPKSNWPGMKSTRYVLVMIAYNLWGASTIIDLSEDGMYINPHYIEPFIVKGVDNV
jgi:hypothetical protein